MPGRLDGVCEELIAAMGQIEDARFRKICTNKLKRCVLMIFVQDKLKDTEDLILIRRTRASATFANTKHWRL